MSDRQSGKRRHRRRAASQEFRVASTLLAACVIGACVIGGCSDRSIATEPNSTEREAVALHVNDERASEREQMVETQIVARGVRDPRVLDAMRRVPRHQFISGIWRAAAYEDRPLPIAASQTISQPYIVAIMTELARLEPGERVLEIGTGSGYQAAVLREIVTDVYSIEIIEELAAQARTTLQALDYDDIHLRQGDGYRGWPEAAPFDAILVTAAPPGIPEPLVEQLAIGGRLVVPVGVGFQELEVHTRTEAGLRRETIFAVRFVPMTGEAQDGR